MTDVFLVRQPLDPAKLDEARELFASIDENPAEVMDVLQAETVYTESAFLETGNAGGGDGTGRADPAILYYIEAEDGATVKDVFYDVMAEPEEMSETVADFARAFEAVVDGEPELVDVEPLYHLVNPERPTEG